MDRRDFLKNAGLALGAGLLASDKPALAAAAPTSPADLSTWEGVRRQFALAPDLLHLQGFFLASHPAPVREAIERHRRALDANPYDYTEQNCGPLETAVRRAAADYLGAKPDDLAMTDSTTMGISLVYNGLKLRPDQEILTTEHDHPVTVWALKYRAQRMGTKVRTVKLFEDSARATADEIVASLARSLRPETRVVALTWVQSNTGLKLPVERVAELLAAENHKRGAADRILFSLDGVHGFGIEDVNVADLGCDFFMAGCHKWLFGPRGTGVLYGSPAGWEAMVPTVPTFDIMWRQGPRDILPISAQTTPGGFHSFEHRWALTEAFKFHEDIGRTRIAERIHALNRQCREGLAAMRHVKLYTPVSAELAAGVVCFDVKNVPGDAVVKRLRESRIVAGTSPYVLKCVRFAPSLLNTPEEIDTALAAVRALA